eukprot:453703_1
MMKLKLSLMLASLHTTINIASSALDCNHLDVHLNMGIISMNVQLLTGVCLTKKENDTDTGLVTTEHTKFECIDGAMFISEYDTADCSGVAKNKINFEQAMQMFAEEGGNMTDPSIICDTGKTCPHVKVREWSEDSRSDCSTSGTIPAGNDLYEDQAYILNHCTSAMMMDFNFSTKYECDNGVVTRSMWMSNQECDGAATEIQTGSVNEYLECDEEDKSVILECCTDKSGKSGATLLIIHICVAIVSLLVILIV